MRRTDELHTHNARDAHQHLHLLHWVNRASQQGLGITYRERRKYTFKLSDTAEQDLDVWTENATDFGTAKEEMPRDDKVPKTGSCAFLEMWTMPQ